MSDSSANGVSRVKRASLAAVVALILSVALGTGAAFAAGGARDSGALTSTAAALVTGKVAAGGPPADVVEHSNIAWDNHVLLLELRAQAASLTDEIRHVIQELRQSGTVIPEDVRQAVKDSRDAIRGSREAIKATIPEVQAERAALHEDRLAKNWAGALGHLENIIAIQETRIAEARHIVAELEAVKTLLEGIG